MYSIGITNLLWRLIVYVDYLILSIYLKEKKIIQHILKKEKNRHVFYAFVKLRKQIG